MKRTWIVLIALFFFFASLSCVASAELAKQGEGTFRMAHTGTYKLLPMGNDRSEAIFEASGLVVEAPENSPLYKASYLVFGSSHRVKDDYEERGSVRYTRPDGDEVFLTYEAKGKVGPERKSKATFVGGDRQVCRNYRGDGSYGHYRNQIPKRRDECRKFNRKV